MNKDKVLIGVLIETQNMSYKEVCTRYHIPEELLLEMLEQGFFSSSATDLEHLNFNPKDLSRLESAFRLHKDLGINLPGVTLALELLEEIEQMRDELEILRKHF